MGSRSSLSETLIPEAFSGLYPLRFSAPFAVGRLIDLFNMLFERSHQFITP